MKQSLIVLLVTSMLNAQELITIAILAKDKAHTLPEYLHCIEHQTWPKDKTNLYIRTNNNTDNTTALLKEWIERVKDAYHEIYFDDTAVPEPVEQYKQHEWNVMRFLVLGQIRKESVVWAKQHNSHYFVADCDNFIMPDTIETLFKTNLPIVAPFLRNGNAYYSNYHAAIDEHGYYADSPIYYTLFNQAIKGLIEVPVVHCTYFIRNEFLDLITYDDHSHRYEYVIFSDCARKAGIPQYLDNRKVYGHITMATTRIDFETEPWFDEVKNY